MPRLKSPGDAQRYLKAREWEHCDDLGLARLWRLPALTGKHYVDTPTALALALQDECERLRAENAKLREKLHEAKRRKS